MEMCPCITVVHQASQVMNVQVSGFKGGYVELKTTCLCVVFLNPSLLNAVWPVYLLSQRMICSHHFSVLPSCNNFSFSKDQLVASP